RPWSGEHAADSAVTVWAPDGLPEFRPGDDLAGALADALTRDPHGLTDGDVVVLTSKVLSKTEGRIVAAPTDPEERDALRRGLVDSESVRVVARVNRTLITENRLGIVQAASGVAGSNVETDEIALLPEDPDGSAAALVGELRRRTGARVAGVVTDTMRRAWRTGEADVAIGAAGLHGSVWSDGVEAGTTARRARDLVRDSASGLFRLGTAEALAQGRRDAVPGRRSVRRFADDPVPAADLADAVADALTAPAPHHSTPIRFVRV